jgi:hypothetical protein
LYEYLFINAFIPSAGGYTRFGAYPNCTHIKIIVKNNLWEKRKGKKKKEKENGTDRDYC